MSRPPTKTLAAVLAALAVVVTVLALPALHPQHPTSLADAGPAFRATTPGADLGANECPLCLGLAQARAILAPTSFGETTTLRTLRLTATVSFDLPAAPDGDGTRARAPPRGA